jgi:hypothetical protein
MIIGELKRNAYMMQVPKQKNQFAITAKQFRKIIFGKFKRSVDKINDLPSEMLSHHVNSAYFLYNMLERFSNLEMINIHISDNRKYTRIYTVNEQNMVGFNYKIVQGVLDYPNFLSYEQLNRFNELLEFLGINYTDNISLDPYYIIRSQDFLNKISKLESESRPLFDYVSDIIDITYEMVEQKIEEDNTYLIIKTDFQV